MTPETMKKLMYEDHDQRWTPMIHHVGPWNPDHRAESIRKRLVWVQTRIGMHTETKHDMGWE